MKFRCYSQTKFCLPLSPSLSSSALKNSFYNPLKSCFPTFEMCSAFLHLPNFYLSFKPHLENQLLQEASMAFLPSPCALSLI